MLVQLGEQTKLWPHHQVGLQWITGPPIDAQLHQQSLCPVPAHSPTKQQDQPYPHAKTAHGAKKQYSQVEDDSHALNKAGKKFIQEVCRVFLYLAHAVD
jgi:hypothetical protein